MTAAVVVQTAEAEHRRKTDFLEPLYRESKVKEGYRYRQWKRWRR